MRIYFMDGNQIAITKGDIEYGFNFYVEYWYGSMPIPRIVDMSNPKDYYLIGQSIFKCFGKHNKDWEIIECTYKATE